MIDVDLAIPRDGFDLAVQARLDARVTGIFGPSGAGKTTLLHAIAGLIRPSQGRIVLGGRVLDDTAAGVAVPPCKRRVGIVFQDMRLFPHRSVRGNLRAGRRRARGGGPTFDAVVAMLELGTLLPRRPAGLSGGERRRVALGRALLSGPEVLLLDEPMAGLDAARRRQILPYVRRVRDELDVPVLHVSHDLAELLEMTDHLLLLDGGKAVGCGRYLDLVQQRPALEVIHDLGLVNVLRLEADAQTPADGHLVAGPANRPRARIRLTGGARGPVTVAIRPEDIALAPGPIERISIRNQLEGRVVRLVRHGGRVLLEIDVGQPLLVEITEHALEQLGFGTGGRVWCLIKTSAIRQV